MPLLNEAMPFGSLWLPVIVSAVAVFVASAVLHMVVKHHRADYKKLSNEEAVREAMGKGNPAPGVYVTPYCAEMKEMREPAMVEKYKKGPVAIMTVYPSGVPNLGKHLALWFLFSVLVSFTASYVARHTLQPGPSGHLAGRVTGAIAFVAYAYGSLSDSIWKGQPWSNTLRELIDSAIYALLTAASFWLLWPAA